MGYSESSEDYRIKFLGFKKIDISKDVIFDEDSSYNKSRKRPAEEPEEVEAPRIHDTTMCYGEKFLWLGVPQQTK